MGSPQPKIETEISKSSDQEEQKSPHFLQRIWKNITIEPAIFVIAFATQMDTITTEQMVVLKSCLTDFQYNETLCHNITDPQWTEQKDEISAALTDFNVYKTLATSLIPIFMAFYLGAYMDLFGRKPIMYLFLITSALQKVVMVICSHWFSSSKWYILLAYIPTSLGGGNAAWNLAISAFLADITQPEERAFRYGMLGWIKKLGNPLAAQAGKYLLEAGGYTCVFSTTLLGIVLGGLLLLWRVHNYDWNPPNKSQEQRKSFSPLVIKDVFVSVFRKRPGAERKYVFLLILISIFRCMPCIGENNISYAYTLSRYNWQVDENSDYRSITSMVDITSQAIFIPLMAYLKWNEAWVMTGLISTLTARHIIKALATEPWMYYLGSIINCIGFYALSIKSSMVSSVVDKNELGKIMAFISAWDSLLPIVVSATYSYVFDVSMVIHTCIFKLTCINLTFRLQKILSLVLFSLSRRVSPLWL